MKANLHCVCQSRMHVANGVAVCRNGACKNFGVEFVAPELELQEVPAPAAAPVVPVVAEAEPAAAEVTEPSAEPTQAETPAD